MLISHQYRFIFIKTVKTAGTSVEAFLEPYCCPPGHVVQHWTPTLVSDFGVVGQRWPNNDRDNLGYYNHMPASAVKSIFPHFDKYSKVTVVRDPYDRAISYFHFSHPTFTPPGGMSLDKAIELVRNGSKDILQESFVRFLRYGLPDEQQLLCIDGVMAIQYCLRFEQLYSDLTKLVKSLSLPITSSISESLPAFKMNRQLRPDCPPIADYLSRDAVELINKQCEWSFDTFNYDRIHLQ